MKLEKLVTSLELSKRLKELGVKQESLFAWYFATDRDDEPGLNRHPDKGCIACGHPLPPYFDWVSAYTAGELGEMLPHTVEVDNIRYFLECGKGATYFNVRYGAAHDMGDPWDEEATTEADARAKMLIFLLTSNLINVTK